LEHRAADDVFGGDQLDLVPLACQLGGDRVGDGAVGVAQPGGEEAVGLDVGKRLAAHAGSLAKRGWVSLSTRAAWRPPSKPAVRKASTQALAMSSPIRRAPSAIALASLCSRASVAA